MKATIYIVTSSITDLMSNSTDECFDGVYYDMESAVRYITGYIGSLRENYPRDYQSEFGPYGSRYERRLKGYSYEFRWHIDPYTIDTEELEFKDEEE